MTLDEFVILTKAMKSIWTHENFLPDEYAVKTWYALLKDIPYETATIAVQKYAQTNTKIPTPADIRREGTGLTGKPTQDWGEAWNEVMRAVGRYGYTNETGAMESFSDLTREAVRRLGWKQICESGLEDQTALRANFRMIYGEIQEKKAEHDMLPDALKEAIEKITGKEVKRIGCM